MSDNDALNTSSGTAPGMRAFQLHVLGGMRNEAMVADALHRLGADHAEMAASRDRTAGVFDPADCFANAAALLGPPLTTQIIDAQPAGYGDLRPITKVTYALSLWPDLVFYIAGMTGFRLPLPHDYGFARPSHAPPLAPAAAEDLRPWAWLRDEVFERFGPPIEEGDIWSPYADYKLAATDADGNRSQFWAVFCWNLLQHIEWA